LATTAPEPYTCNHRAGGALLRTPPASTASEQASTAPSVEGECAVGAHPRRAVGEGSHVFSPPDPRLPLEGARPAAAVGSASPWCSDRLRGERAAVELGPPPPWRDEGRRLREPTGGRGRWRSVESGRSSTRRHVKGASSSAVTGRVREGGRRLRRYAA
jgi:hypothetical protein